MRLFATTSLMFLLPAAGVAADRYHVVTPSFGCVVPWTTWALNDGHNPHRRDARWLNRIIDRGGCRLVSPIQEWERVGRVGRLVLLRQVPPHSGATPLLFRPSDLRVGEIAEPAPAAAPEATTTAAPPVQPDPAQGAEASPPAAPASTDATPSGSADRSAPPPSAAPVPPSQAAPQPPAAAPSSTTSLPSGRQASLPATPNADPPSTPPAGGSGPATQKPPSTATQEPTVPATQEPPSIATQEAPVIATPLAAPATDTAPTPAPDAATPASPPAPAVPPSARAPAAAAPDAVAQPSDATPVHATDALATIRTMSPRSRFIIGLGAILAVLAGLMVIGLRFLVGRRRDRRTTGQPPAEPYDAPELPADEADVPPIDGNAYRRWCVDSLTEAGWQARMSFPAGRLTADIMARRDGRLLTVQCRPSTRPLEAAVVQEALVVRRAQDAQVAAVVSNAGYTRAARNLAAASGVRLLHETELPEFVS